MKRPAEICGKNETEATSQPRGISKWAEGELRRNGLRMEWRDSRGRTLVTSRRFSAGDLLLECEPYVAVLHCHLRDRRCHQCFGEPTPGCDLLRCSACKVALYCSRECQRAAWTTSAHRTECRAIRDAKNHLPLPSGSAGDEAELACRAFWRREGERGVVGMSWEDVEGLCWHGEHDGRATRELARVVASRCGAGVEEASRMLCRMQANDFAVWDGLIFSRGAAVFPLGALVNHSCRATSVVTYRLDPTSRVSMQQFRACRDLEPGEEITHCYSDLASTTAARRAHLRESYCFDCACEGCADEEGWRRLDAELERVAAGATRETLERAAAMYERGCDLRLDASENRKLLAAAMQIRRELLGPLSLDRMSTAAHLMSTCMELGDDLMAAQLAQEVLAVYRAVYPAVHPMLGLHLYTLGDLLETLPGRQADAKAAHLEALAILTITHGSDSDLVVGLRQKTS